MMTAEKIRELSPAEHSVWTAYLRVDETLILHTSIGLRYTLVLLSISKRFLSQTIPADCRLRFLEWMDRRSDTFSKEAIALIEPMNDEGYEIFREANKLGPNKALDISASWEVFNAYAAINPSILTALRMSRPNGYDASAMK
jgi:hypothetical protein